MESCDVIRIFLYRGTSTRQYFLLIKSFLLFFKKANRCVNVLKKNLLHTKFAAWGTLDRLSLLRYYSQNYFMLFLNFLTRTFITNLSTRLHHLQCNLVEFFFWNYFFICNFLNSFCWCIFRYWPRIGNAFPHPPNFPTSLMCHKYILRQIRWNTVFSSGSFPQLWVKE